jgi:hypothetical protein
LAVWCAVEPILYTFRPGTEMWLFLVLFWCAAAGAFPNYSRFGASNSRLVLRRESPGKALVCFTIFAAEQRERGESRQNSRFYGNTGNLPAAAAALAVVGADQLGALDHIRLRRL